MSRLVIPHTNEDEALQEAKQSSSKIGGKVGYGINDELPCYKVLNIHGKVIECHTYPKGATMYYQPNCQPT